MTDPLLLRIIATTKRCYCVWRAEIAWRSGDQSGVMRIDNNGKGYAVVGDDGATAFGSDGFRWRLRMARAPAAGAGSTPYVATDLGPKQHPRTLITHQPGVTYSLTSLRWKNWGKPRPQAHGRMTVCANMASCEKLGSTTIQLRQLREGRCETVRGRYYVRGTIIRNAKRTPVDLDPSYVC